MDVKKAIALGIQRQLLNDIPLTGEPVEQLEFGGAEITASAVSELITLIRVKTRSQGVRYFTVRVSEML